MASGLHFPVLLTPTWTALPARAFILCCTAAIEMESNPPTRCTQQSSHITRPIMLVSGRNAQEIVASVCMPAPRFVFRMHVMGRHVGYTHTPTIPHRASQMRRYPSSSRLDSRHVGPPPSPTVSMPAQPAHNLIPRHTPHNSPGLFMKPTHEQGSSPPHPLALRLS